MKLCSLFTIFFELKLAGRLQKYSVAVDTKVA